MTTAPVALALAAVILSASEESRSFGKPQDDREGASG